MGARYQGFTLKKSYLQQQIAKIERHPINITSICIGHNIESTDTLGCSWIEWLWMDFLSEKKMQGIPHKSVIQT